MKKIISVQNITISMSAILLLCTPFAYADRCSGDFPFTPEVPGSVKVAVEKGMKTKFYRLTKKENATFDGSLQKIQDVIIDQPYFKPPMGVVLHGGLRSWELSGCSTPCLDRPVSGQGGLYFRELVHDNGKIGPAVEPGSSIMFSINNLEEATGVPLSREFKDNQGRLIIAQMRQDGEINGASVYKDEGTGNAVLVLNRAGKSWFLPLSQEEFLKVTIKGLEKELVDMALVSNTPAADALRKWRQELPEKRVEAEKLYAELKKTNLSLAETIRKSNQQLEKDLEQMYVQEAEQETRRGVPESMSSLVGKKLEKHRQALRDMPVSERKKQAFYLRSDDPFAPDLADPTSKSGGKPLVVVNNDYFDRSLPRTAIQIIAIKVGIFLVDTPEDSCLLINPAGILARKTIQETPWDKIRKTFIK